MNEALALEIFKSQMVIVVEGLKIMAYANGGAVVALLALLGSLAGRCTTVPHVTRAILCFVAGLVTSIMSFFLSYFTQMIVVKGFFDDFCDWIPHHRLLFSFTVIAIVIGLFCFVLGTYLAAKELANFNCTPPD